MLKRRANNNFLFGLGFEPSQGDLGQLVIIQHDWKTLVALRKKNTTTKGETATEGGALPPTPLVQVPMIRDRHKGGDSAKVLRWCKQKRKKEKMKVIMVVVTWTEAPWPR